MRFFLELQYKGTKYRGWQRQLKVRSVQEKLEEALSKIFKHKLTCHGCGRTDAGVHASQFFAHFYLKEPVEFDIVERLNFTLPEDIRIQRCFEVGNHMNAQKSALARTYIYKIHTTENPFLADLSSYYDFTKVDFKKLEFAAAAILNAKDFKALCKRPELMDNTLCEITESFWRRIDDGSRYEYHIRADRFLQGMVRLLVGTMLEMASGKMSQEEFVDHLKNQTPLPFYRAAFPQGLYIAGVEYAFD